MDLIKVQLLTDTEEIFWDDLIYDCINFAWPDAEISAYEEGEGTNLLVLEGPPEMDMNIIGERLPTFIHQLQELGYSVEKSTLP